MTRAGGHFPIDKKSKRKHGEREGGEIITI